jgi:hypothetical protein
MVNFLCKFGVPFSSMSDRERERERAKENSFLVCCRQKKGQAEADSRREARREGLGGSVGGRQIALSPANIH